jgi:hypothetical protein
MTFDAKKSVVKPKAGGQENKRAERNRADMEKPPEGKPTEGQQLSEKQPRGDEEMATDQRYIIS